MGLVMKKIFKTNIKCSACIEKVKPFLDVRYGTDFWTVDLMHPDRLLTIDSDLTDENTLLSGLQELGYQAIQAEEIK